MSKSKNPAGSTDGKEIVITRHFQAPPELVFQAWTQPVHLARWWGPAGFTSPVCHWDVRVGGRIHHVMRAANGVDYPMGGEFREIVPSSRLVLTTGALDPAGRLMFEFLHTLEFAPGAGGTDLTLRSRLMAATPGSEGYTGGFKMGMTQSWERLADLVEKVAPCEIVISRVLHAPRELVWQAWTDPQHVTHWWGPRGFTTTVEQHDFRVGGAWKHLMHGPDGTNYPNKSIFKEIVPLERITFAHGGGREEGPGATFTATWTFETVEGNKTRLTGRMVFPSKEARDFVVQEFGAIEGGKQTLERAAEYVSGMLTQPFIISREFAAPRDLVWKAWTEREHFMAWFGPKGFKNTYAKMDLTPGGMFHHCMVSPDGMKIWGRAVYREVVPPTKLVWIDSFSDKAGGITSHPFSKDPWPQQMLTVVTFAEQAGKTTVTVHFSPFDSSEAERRTFEAGRESMKLGWGGTLDRLTAYLAAPLK